ncbi:hypothetical protein STTU_3456 [Streptomyces sp. Tu6071]|nr:hypothetical protein STTU_3456 [Streptomyces sp. Tu6071]
MCGGGGAAGGSWGCLWGWTAASVRGRERLRARPRTAGGIPRIPRGPEGSPESFDPSPVSPVGPPPRGSRTGPGGLRAPPSPP